MVPLSVIEAQARTRALVRPAPVEWVGLETALGRVLAAPLKARLDHPAAPVSAMDGYACKGADTNDRAKALAVVGEVPAGRAFDRGIGQGEAVRIFTGGVVPDGADAILIQENARAEGGTVFPLEPVAPGVFVRPKGLDFRTGDALLRPGRVLDPIALALAAGMGHLWLPVRRRPRVAVLGTGDELVRPGEAAAAHQVISSNNLVLAGLARLWGGEPVDLGIARDTPGALAEALEGAEGADIVVTSGGASVGDYDLVQSVAGKGGLDLDCWKIAMRPGKPLIAGRFRGAAFLGLPGNPVSAAVCGVVFLRGMLKSALGLDPALPWRPVPLHRALAANDGREEMMRAFYVGGADGAVSVDPAPRQDSSMLATLALADALVRRPVRDPARAAGEACDTLDLRAALNPLG